LESFTEFEHYTGNIEGSFCLVAWFEIDFAFGINVLEGLNQLIKLVDDDYGLLVENLENLIEA
jgi:hypothetical protein